jgi:hypothetical protein
MADPRQVQSWLEGLEKERSAKIGETSGVGDLLNLLGLLKNPAMEAATQGAAALDEGLGLNNSKFSQGVVSPAVKKQRAAAISALQPVKSRRVDMIPRKMATPEKLKASLIQKGVPEKHAEFDDFYFSPSPRSKEYEILVNGLPKTGLTVTPSKNNKEGLKVDAGSRFNYEELLKYEDAKKLYKQAVADRDAMWQERIKNPNAPKPPGELPSYPTSDYKKLQKTSNDPAAVKQLSKALAALYPQFEKIGGIRGSGVRGKAGFSGNPQTEVALPKLSPATAQKARSQVTKWLDELINSRATR